MTKAEAGALNTGGQGAECKARARAHITPPSPPLSPRLLRGADGMGRGARRPLALL